MFFSVVEEEDEMDSPSTSSAAMRHSARDKHTCANLLQKVVDSGNTLFQDLAC